MSKSNLVKDLVAEIKAVAEKLKVKPEQLTKTQFLANTKFKEWDLRKVGGFSSILKSYFPFQDKDLASITDQKSKQSYVRKLEQTTGEALLAQQRIPELVADAVTRNAVIKPLILDAKTTKKYIESIHADPSDKTDNSNRSICTIWSDQHFGTNFTKEEMNGLNEYNWTVSARRLAMLCEQLATFKLEKRGSHEELVIFMLGDNIAGVIHGQEGSQADLSAEQVWGTAGYYIQAITYLLNFFPKIRVEFQTGNHGRVMHKSSKDRAMQQKWDSFETNFATAIMAHFAKEPRVLIHIPKAPYSDVMVQGHRIYATHGDTVFNVGNPGKAVPLGSIDAHISKVNGNLPSDAKKFELFCTGHVHHPVSTHVGGVKVLINGSLIGTDPFALSVGITDSNPTQVVWETTRRYVQGDTRQIYVADADTASKDKQQRFDSIIKPFQTSFGDFKIWWA